MADATDAYTYPPVEAVIATEAALVQSLDAQLGGDWHGDSLLGPVDDGCLAIYTVNATDWQRVHDLLAYIWQGPMSGEWWDQTPEVLIDSHLFVFSIDTTKSQRDDVPDAWDSCKGILIEGTAIRKTNKAGPGTKGTRAIAGIGPVLMAWGGPR